MKTIEPNKKRSIEDVTIRTGKVTIRDTLVCNIIFSNEQDNVVGWLDWPDSVVNFTGNATESAQIFFEELKKLNSQFKAHIEWMIEKRMAELQSKGENHG